MGRTSRLLIAAATLIACAGVTRLAYEAYKLRIGTRVLFIGNSFTYVNNLPAVFATLGRTSGLRVATAMLVESGATLSDRVSDASAQRMLETDRYDYVVLQERAGSLVCGLHKQELADDCELSRRAHHEIADVAHARGAKVVVLGTYVSSPELAAQLQAAERAIAGEVGAIYVPVVSKLARGMRDFPQLNWLARDGHPGSELTLLEAVLLYRAVFSSAPRTEALTVRAPIYGPASEIFTLDWRSVRAPAGELVYDRPALARAIELAGEP